MAKQLNQRVDWVKLVRRYKRSGTKGKSRLLDELCDLYKMNRKYLIRRLNQRQKKPITRRGPKATYPPEIFCTILKRFWFSCDQMCSKKLKAAIALWLSSYEKHYGTLNPEIKCKLLKLSAATIDRILKPVRLKSTRRRLCGTRPGTLLKHHIPIKTNQWDETEPGFVEADTVAHCGNSLAGEFVWSLTLTDIVTTWTENRAVWNKGSEGVVTQIKDIEVQLPFTLKGFDCDNGSEFLNWHLVRYFSNKSRNSNVQFTRSRPYKKNDNAHVEQKNWTHVRQLFGYDRFDNRVVVDLMNDLYRNEWSLLQNHFMPSTKCIAKMKINSKYKKKFDQPKTPYERVLNCSSIANDIKKRLQETHAKLDPFELKKMVEQKLKFIFKYVQLSEKVRHRL